MDLGTGTGQIAIPLAPFVGEVVAVDSEQEMLDEGQKVASRNKVDNIKWIQRKAEDVSDDLEMFDVTTIGAAFHWMDRKEVLSKVYEVTKDRGGVVIVSDFRRGTAPQYGEDWKEVRKNIVAKYLGEKRRAGNSFYEKDDDKFEDRLRGSPFGGYEEWHYDFMRTWTLEEAKNFLYSTSFASKRFFGDRLAQFEKDLSEALMDLEPEGIFKEEVRLQALVGKK